MEPITIPELMSLSRKAFIDRNLKWMKEFNNNEHIIILKKNERGDLINDPEACPLHIWVQHNHAKCPNRFVALTGFCPICGNPCCPDCMNHKVDQISRVTGYLSTVSGWGSAKTQEFKDRHRHDL